MHWRITAIFRAMATFAFFIPILLASFIPEALREDHFFAVLSDGLPAVEAACAEAITQGVHSADVVLNILARQRDRGPPATILTLAARTRAMRESG
jgi:hypothetical protein